MLVQRIDPAVPLAMALFSSLVFSYWVSAFSRIKILSAVVLVLAVNAIVAGRLMMTENVENTYSERVSFPMLPPNATAPFSLALFIFAMFVAVNLGLAMGTKLYIAAIQRRASEAELELGAAGVRAWLSPFNIVTAICFAATGYVGFNWNIVVGLFLAASLLLAYPLINTFLHQKPMASAPSQASQAPADERQRVLALVEAGKITADDAAELLSALAQSQVAGIEAAGTISGPRRLMLVGAAIAFVGFFLPWFTINESFGGFKPTPTNMIDSMPVPVQNNLQITVRGGDVRNGLGWITLAAGLCAAALPFFWIPTSQSSQQHRNIVLGALFVGTVGMLYLLSNSFNSVTSIEPGFMIAMAGYVLLWIGAVREYVTRGQSFQPLAAMT